MAAQSQLNTLTGLVTSLWQMLFFWFFSSALISRVTSTYGARAVPACCPGDLKCVKQKCL